MHLTGWHIEGYKKIKCADLDFDGQKLVQIRGKGGSGKTSILETFGLMFQGGKTEKDDITHGEEKTYLFGTFGDYTAYKTIFADGRSPKLTVKKEGFGDVKPAQAFMDKIAGEFIDPVWFAELEGDKARENLVDYLNINFAPIDANIKQKEEARKLKGQLRDAVGKPNPCDKVEAVSATELLAERKKIEEFNKTQDERAQTIQANLYTIRDSIIKAIDRNSNIIEKQKSDSIDKLVDNFTEAFKIYDGSLKGLKALPAPEEKKPTTAIDEKILKADEVNVKATAYKTYIDTKAKRDALQAEYDAFTAEIEALRQERSDMLTKAALPIKELVITDDNLTFKGTVWKGLSTSEKIRISLLLAVHFAGELKLVYIKRGESLDAETLAQLVDFAIKHDFQIIIEIVDSSYSVEGDGVFQIEEGKIVGVKHAE